MLTKVFVGASALAGFVGGSVAAVAFGLPMTVAFAAAAGAGAASALSSVIVGGAFDGKGPSAGFLGMMALPAAHATFVPAMAVMATKLALGG